MVKLWPLWKWLSQLETDILRKAVTYAPGSIWREDDSLRSAAMRRLDPEEKKKDEKDEKDEKEQAGGLLVEDETVAGGKDKTTGADVICPKGTDGKVDESTDATDKRENKPEKPPDKPKK